MKKKILGPIIGFVITIACVFPASAECLSGGAGASDCSASVGVGPASISISVSCREGYYACCNSEGAKCIKDTFSMN